MGLSKVADGELDELQKWKLEKKAREEQKEREDRESVNANNSTDTSTSVPNTGEALYSSSTSAVDNNAEEHKTPRPSNVRYELPSNSSVPPLSSNAAQELNTATSASTTGGEPATNALATLKALMSKSQGELAPVVGTSASTANGAPISAFGVASAVEPSQPANQVTSFSSVVSRPVQSSTSSVKYDSDENRRPVGKYIVCLVTHPKIYSLHS
jgi:hypothetical protein